MTVGELFLGSFSTGVITPAEIEWLLSHHDSCSREEKPPCSGLDGYSMTEPFTWDVGWAPEPRGRW